MTWGQLYDDNSPTNPRMSSNKGQIQLNFH